MPTAIFLSPHLDDVAFSCGGTLARLVSEGWRCVLVTAFTRSMPDPTGFALACQLDKGLPADVDYMALRREEDEAFARMVGAESVWLDLPEAPHRGYESATELFGEVKAEDGIAALLARSLRGLQRTLKPALMFYPQALGHHVDHVQTARAAAACDVPGYRYRDLPYAMRHSDTAEGDSRDTDIACAVDCTLESKLAGCAAYRTQIAFQFGSEASMRRQLTAHAAAECRSAGLRARFAERFRK